MKKVFITGATGFVGSYILSELINQGFIVGCLVRYPHIRLDGLPVKTIIGDVTEPDSFKDKLAEYDAIISLVAIINENRGKGASFETINFQATADLVELAGKSGIKRFIHMSALGANPDGITPYFQSKGKAEEAVRSSGLDYTIFRPSFIYGPDDAVYSMIARMLKKTPFGLFPVFGDGNYRHQPVSVTDIAKAFVGSVENSDTINKTYDIGGPEALSFNDQLKMIANVITRPCNLLHIPMPVSRLLVRIAQQVSFSPIDMDRLKMLTSDNLCDNTNVEKDLEIKLLEFRDEIKYLNWRYYE